MKKKKLKWGQTPWDDMPKEKLLREVQRMYSALVSLNSVFNLVKTNNEDHPFYSKNGSGGRAQEKARQILDPLHRQYKNGDSELYRSFFRYADDLLFDTKSVVIGSGWAVCPKCKNMFGWNREHEQNKAPFGQRCGEYSGFSGDCKGVLRKLNWRDLKPNV